MPASGGTGSQDGTAATICAFFCGAFAGAALAALIAPARGRETRERLRSTVREAFEHRHEFIARLEEQLEEWSARIEALGSRAGGISADARHEFDRQVDELRARLEEARRTLHDVRTSGEHAWQDLASGAEQAWRELRRAVERASSRFS